jgi:hypothetical protein
MTKTTKRKPTKPKTKTRGTGTGPLTERMADALAALVDLVDWRETPARSDRVETWAAIGVRKVARELRRRGIRVHA